MPSFIEFLMLKRNSRSNLTNTINIVIVSAFFSNCTCIYWISWLSLWFTQSWVNHLWRFVWFVVIWQRNLYNFHPSEVPSIVYSGLADKLKTAQKDIKRLKAVTYVSNITSCCCLLRHFPTAYTCSRAPLRCSVWGFLLIIVVFSFCPLELFDSPYQELHKGFYDKGMLFAAEVCPAQCTLPSFKARV